MLKFQWRGGQSPEPDMGDTGGGYMRELKRRLQEDGLDPAASDDAKLHHLWALYIKTESSLKGSLASIEELRDQQAEEMREVENYVEHIRSLSDEREALTLEFEAENENLKADIVRLTNALEGYKSEEIREMLMQQSLDEIADGTMSEQIAYLLVERARLMDELEAVEVRMTVDTPDGLMSGTQLLELLESERVEFEEELGQQRQNLRGVKDEMRLAHEEEISTMMTENEKLQDMLDEAKTQTTALQQAVASLRDQLKKQEVIITERSSSQMEVETERAAREHAEFEVHQLQCHLDELKADTQTLVDSARTTQVELTNFRDECKASSEVQTKLKQTVTEKEELVSMLQETNQKLTSEVQKLEVQLQLSQDKADDLHHQSNGLVLTTGDNLKSRLENEMQDLKKQNHKLQSDLLTVKLTHEEEILKVSSTSLQQEDNRIEELKDEHTKEIGTLMSKIHILEQKVSSLEGDLATSQREVWSQHNEFKKVDPEELAVVEQKLRDAIDRQREQADRLKEVTAEKDELFNLLETQRQQNSNLRQEMGVNMERISALEKYGYQLEAENGQSTAKLMAALEAANEKESQVKVLERRESEERMAAIYITVDDLKLEVQRLNAQLAQAKAKLQHAEQSRDAQKDLYETETQGLGNEVDRLHTKHQAELQSVSERLEAAYNDVTELKKRLNEREEELTRLRNETNLLLSAEAKLKIKLDTEEQRYSGLELSHASLTEQSDKAWAQTKKLSIKVSTLESTNENLRQELNRKTNTFHDTENQLSHRITDHTMKLDTMTRRAVTAEAKLTNLQRDLEKALTQLQTAEEQLRESASLRAELLMKQEEISRLREKLQDEQLQKTYVSQGSEELTTQLALLHEKERAAVARSNDLQHILLDVEAKLGSMKDHTQNTASIRVQAEVGRKALVDQVAKMQWEVESLQTELTATTERYEVQVRKYNDRKMRTKNKLQKARELFHTERTKCQEEVDDLQAELRSAHASAAKDAEWKTQLEDTYKKLLFEKRELLSQMTEKEELVHDQNRSLSVLQVRSRYLEEENNNLQSRIDSLTRQKCNLDKLIKEYQLERHKEAIDAMSIDIDALMSPRINTEPMGYVTALSNQNQISTIIEYQSPLVDALVSPRVMSPHPGGHMMLLSTNRGSFPQHLEVDDDDGVSHPVPVYDGMVSSMHHHDLDSDGIDL